MFPVDVELVEDLARMIAALCRYANHDWDRAEELTLSELFWRFDAMQALLKAEHDAAKKK